MKKRVEEARRNCKRIVEWLKKNGFKKVQGSQWDRGRISVDITLSGLVVTKRISSHPMYWKQVRIKEWDLEQLKKVL